MTEHRYESPNGPPTPELPSALVDTAILWSLKLDYGPTTTPATRQAFEEWIAADPRHSEAWRRITSLHSDFARLPPQAALDTLRTVDARRRARKLDRRQALKMLCLAGVGLGTGWVTWRHTPWQRLLADTSTGIGEQQTLTLEDGSTLVLNTDTAISTDLTGEHRHIRLRRGEIQVTTGPDAGVQNKRPFWVYTPFGKMQALGTRFVVRLDQKGARVSVLDGAVELHPAQNAEPVVVNIGESRWLTAESTASISEAEFVADAWVQGVITARNMRLADLLAELNRYSAGLIQCDERVADLRLSGVFQTTDTEKTLRFLTQIQPLSLQYRTSYWITVGPLG